MRSPHVLLPSTPHITAAGWVIFFFWSSLPAPPLFLASSSIIQGHWNLFSPHPCFSALPLWLKLPLQARPSIALPLIRASAAVKLLATYITPTLHQCPPPASPPALPSPFKSQPTTTAKHLDPPPLVFQLAETRGQGFRGLGTLVCLYVGVWLWEQSRAAVRIKAPAFCCML